MEQGIAVREGCEEITAPHAVAEAMILGLRLIDGVQYAEFRQRYGQSPSALYASQVAELTELELVEVTAERLRLTTRGHLVANRVFGYFWPPPTRDPLE